MPVWEISTLCKYGITCSLNVIFRCLFFLLKVNKTAMFFVLCCQVSRSDWVLCWCVQVLAGVLSRRNLQPGKRQVLAMCRSVWKMEDFSHLSSVTVPTAGVFLRVDRSSLLHAVTEAQGKHPLVTVSTAQWIILTDFWFNTPFDYIFLFVLSSFVSSPLWGLHSSWCHSLW